MLPPAELARSTAPLIETEPVSQCPVCGHGSFAAVAEGFDYELLSCKNLWRFVGCHGCGHVWLNPRPAARCLPVIYPPSYYAYNYQEINWLARRGKALLDRFKLGGILTRLGRPPRSYLDIGCGDGRYLRAMERRGLGRPDLYGLELSADGVADLEAEGYQVFCGRVEDVRNLPAERFDLITMFHVIEHIGDPGRTLERIRSWLARGGVLAIETPNLDSLDARLFAGGIWGGYHIPRHWSLFTPKTLEQLLRRAGFEVIAIRFLTGHSFWMYSFHHLLRYGRPPRPRLARWFDPFKGLPLLAAFTAFDKLRAALRFRTSSMLVLAARSEGS